MSKKKSVLKQITETNRQAWNEVTPIHQRNRTVNLAEKFTKPGYSTLDDLITQKMASIGLGGKRVAQLGCNNGRELLSLINLGAAAGVGFDISDEAIAEARQLAVVSVMNAQFVRTDVYDINHDYDGQFDLIYISIGVLSWLPDLVPFFEIVSRLLVPGGALVIYEQHPYLFMLAARDEAEFDKDNPLKIANSYFRTDPWISTTGMDYVGKTVYEAKPSISFTQTFACILNAIVHSGINLVELQEYAHDISGAFEHLSDDSGIPRSYVLTGRKS